MKLGVGKKLVDKTVYFIFFFFFVNTFFTEILLSAVKRPMIKTKSCIRVHYFTFRQHYIRKVKVSLKYYMFINIL